MNITWLTTELTQLGLPHAAAYLAAITALLLTVLLIAAAANMIIRKTLLPIVLQWITSNKYQWDEPLLRYNFFSRICWYVPISIISISLDTILLHNTALYLFAHRLVLSGFVVISVLSLTALLSSTNDIYQLVHKTRRSTLQGYTDAAKILVYIFGVIFIVSIFTGTSPWGIISILGGLTAVTMLVFKDSILGFVASIQLNATDMVRLGDWIEMPKFGADGDVISISIHTVKVQNWDKTITTIPTYAMVSSSFKNWRGMTESGGRRIKRSLSIDLHSICFCSDDMLEQLSRVEILKDYLKQKNADIRESINEHHTDTSISLNGRRQTNVGIFRAYIIAYLKNNKHVHDGMTFLVRQLAPSNNGLPLEIYVFSKDQAWANYEAIQADIFDHLLAAASEFGLRIFQTPSGFDLRALANLDGVQS